MDPSLACKHAVAWSGANDCFLFLFPRMALFSAGEVKNPAVNYLVTWQAELLLRRSSLICIVISMLAKSPPHTCVSFHHICCWLLCMRKAVSVFWRMLSVCLCFRWLRHPGPDFLGTSSSRYGVGSSHTCSIMLLSCAKNNQDPGWDFIYNSWFWFINLSIKPENDIFAGCIPICIILDI